MGGGEGRGRKTGAGGSRGRAVSGGRVNIKGGGVLMERWKGRERGKG